MIISGPHQTCAGNEITLVAAPGYASYDWFPDHQSTQSIVVSPVVSTTYYVVASNPGSDPVTSIPHLVTVYTLPVPEVQYVSSVSAYGEVWSDISSPIFVNDNFVQLRTKDTYASYQWFLNGRPIVGANYRYYTAMLSGTYSVRVASQNGCSSRNEAEYSINVKSFAGCAITLLSPPNGAKGVPVNTEVIFDVRFNFTPIPSKDDISIFITDGDSPVRYNTGHLTIYEPGDPMGTDGGYRYRLNGIRFRAGSPIKIRVKVGTPTEPVYGCEY